MPSWINGDSGKGRNLPRVMWLVCDRPPACLQGLPNPLVSPAEQNWLPIWGQDRMGLQGVMDQLWGKGVLEHRIQAQPASSV